MIARELLIKFQMSRLIFRQFNQGFDLTCAVRTLGAQDYGYDTTYWHNSLFNPTIPPGFRILGFQPDWERSDGGA
jgi:hypothetical protein